MKLTPREKKRIKKKRIIQSRIDKAKENIEPLAHPGIAIEDRARKYSKETQKNYRQIIGPPQYSRSESFRHLRKEAKNMNPFKKVWTVIWVGGLIICMLIGIFTTYF